MRFLVVSAALVAGLFLVPACGGDDDSSGNAVDPNNPDGSTTTQSGSASSSTSTSSSSSSGGTPGTPTAGCGKAVPKSGFLGSQKINGRTYELYLPDNYDPSTPYPVVVSFHGDGGTGAGERTSLKLEDASGKKAIIAYPDGLGKTWNTDDLTKMNADIAFGDAIIASLESTYCTAKGKILVTGVSRGGYFVNQYACRSKTPVTAVVSHAGGGPYQVKGETIYVKGVLTCPQPPVPALQVIGQSDGYLGDGKKARDYYTAIDKCQTTTTAYDPSPCVKYNGCAHPEVYCEIPGLGHTTWDKAAATTWKFFTEQ